jgi:hypothetical protein
MVSHRVKSPSSWESYALQKCLPATGFGLLLAVGTRREQYLVSAQQYETNHAACSRAVLAQHDVDTINPS